MEVPAPVDQEAQPATVSQSPSPAGKIGQDKVALKKLRRRARKFVSRRRLLPGPLNPQLGHFYQGTLRGIVSYFTTYEIFLRITAHAEADAIRVRKP